MLENNQLLPFERNRYYVGKLLTSADFAAEQTYFNNKRRFLSSLMFGAGIVCGLGVYNLDDQSIMVESGVAVDGYGREIVLEGSVVKSSPPWRASRGWAETGRFCVCATARNPSTRSIPSAARSRARSMSSTA